MLCPRCKNKGKKVKMSVGDYKYVCPECKKEIKWSLGNRSYLW